MTQILYSYISEKNHELLVKELLPEFSIDFSDRILKYRRWQDTQLSLIGRVLLRNGFNMLNKKFSEEDMCYTKYNKPYFKNENIKFNISHSGNMVVCAITENFEVGIDIEVLQDIEIEDFRLQMTALEWERVVSSSNTKNSFFKYWTQKEAVIKASGKGLSIPLDSFEVINNQTKIDHEGFLLREIELNDKYKCHLAFKGNKVNLRSNIINPVISEYQF